MSAGEVLGGGRAKGAKKSEENSVIADDSLEGAKGAPVALRTKKMSADKGEGLWLMSFSDMSLILMSFFVLQLAMSAPDKRKTDQLADELSQTERKGSLKHISEELIKEIKHRELGHLTEVSMDMNGLSIEFRDHAFFQTGSAQPRQQSLKNLEKIMEIIRMASGNYQLVFEGHTDDVPLRGGRYSSNWELSGARSLALLTEFKRKGVPEERMAIRSFAQTKPKVSVLGLSGASLNQARAANRRVVIRLE